ncbi:MAG: site-specific integrase [Methyloceanibacter sp.]
MKLHQSSIPKLSLARGKAEAIFFDDELPGFGLRLRAGGARGFIVQYKIGAKQRRMTLGSVRELSLAQARAHARDVLAEVHLGEDPQGDKAMARVTASETFRAVAERFLTRQAKRLRPSSYAGTKLYLHGLKLDKIGRAEIASRLATIAETSGPVSADRARAALSALFAWAIREGLCDVNPVIGTNKSAETRPRERVLSDEELTTIWRALPETNYGHIVKLLILTGSRREEIAGLRHSEIDFKSRRIALAAERTKNHRPHDIPLSQAAYGFLSSLPQRDSRELVFGAGVGGFQGWSRSKATLDAKLNDMAPWRLHDLRRTVATGMAELGVHPHIIEAVLNHISGHKAGVASVYNRAVYAPEKAAALELWGRHVLSLAERA